MSNSCSLFWLCTQLFAPRAPFHISAADPGGCSQAQHLPSAMCCCSNLGAVSQIWLIQQPFLGIFVLQKPFLASEKEKKRQFIWPLCSVAMAGEGAGMQGAQSLKDLGRKPFKTVFEAMSQFFSEQLSGSSGFYIFLSRWEFSPASSTGTLGFWEAFEPREVAQPIFRLIDFCGWLKCWQDHSGLLQKCMISVKSWAI